MSNIYIKEPPTNGKVLLKTTVGDIEIELWSREAPKACRNFVQLCLENYYNKTKFHRVVKDFIVQGGDPTGTGNGGESVYGKPFVDEFHSRLRFVRRGLVAMANSGKDNNGSQFFFTLGPAQELQNKHTIFGQVAGDTIYNMLKLQDGIVQDEKPLSPNMILKTKVLVNPFDDIQPRELISMIKDEKKDKKPQSKMKATKDFGLLSFGDEAEEEEEELKEVNKDFETKGKSSHDLLSDPKLSSQTGESLLAEDQPPESSDKTKDDIDMDLLKQKLKKKKDVPGAPTLASKTFEVAAIDDDDDKDQNNLTSIQDEIKALKKQMRQDRKRRLNLDDDDTEAKKDRGLTEEEKNNDMLLEFHKNQEAYKSKKPAKKKTSSREDLTMQMLAKFKNKLNTVKETQSAPDIVGDMDQEDDVQGDDWMANSLKFDANDPVLAKDASSKDDDWFDIYDPRNPLNKRRRERDRKGSSRKK